MSSTDQEPGEAPRKPTLQPPLASTVAFGVHTVSSSTTAHSQVAGHAWFGPQATVHTPDEVGDFKRHRSLAQSATLVHALPKPVRSIVHAPFPSASRVQVCDESTQSAEVLHGMVQVPT